MSGPISTREFFKLISSLGLRFSTKSRKSDLLNIGLAVSGGVDSTALAGLCSQINQVDLSQFPEFERLGLERRHRFSFKAFVFDHGARDGSAEEAFQVSKNLGKIGIPAQIMKLQWPGDGNPNGSSNFETRARRLRYQALGKACYSHGIGALFTAHHADDLVETMILRLIRNGKKSHVGDQWASTIAECAGIYGTHSGGDLIQVGRPENEECRRLWGAESPEQCHQKRNPRLAPLHVETLGVLLYRPFTGYSKSRLIETSKHLNLPWFEDETNRDPSVTTRNAIRYLYQNDLMPNALCKSAVLRVVKNGTPNLENRTSFGGIHIDDFNARAGTMKLRLPKSIAHDIQSEAGSASVIANNIRILMSAVSPYERIKDRHKRLIMLRKLIDEKTGSTFTHSGLLLKQQAATSDHLTWLLSRQPHGVSPNYINPSVTFHPSHTHIPRIWSQWERFDGRFWIRISNPTRYPVVIRPFQQPDLTMCCSVPLNILSMEGEGENYYRKIQPLSDIGFKEMLRNYAPEDIKYTLPALEVVSEGQERLFALPTLDVATEALMKCGVAWEVRYKDIFRIGGWLHNFFRSEGLIQRASR